MLNFLLAIVIFGLMLAVAVRGFIQSERAVKNPETAPRPGSEQPAEAQAGPKS